MSKAKTKKARRELKRDGLRKIAAHQRRTAKAAATPANTAKPLPKKQQQTKKMTDTPTPHVQASQKHPVPFGPYDHILLVGEGDFSFTRALALHHGCANVTATSYDSGSVVREKYPEYEGIHDELTALVPPVPVFHDVDATKISSYKHLRCIREEEDGEDGRNGEGWDTIAFQFPHTGGLSTDVNRQVRANQALLVDFFKSCLETSSPKARLAVLAAQRAPSPLRPRTPFLRLGGRIIVTLFEGEPYTLWNVRDLARHVGLKVVESWRFDAREYEGYKHVRTLGAIEGGGGWKGEDRDARMYVFEKVELVPDSEEEEELERMGMGRGKKGKAKGKDGGRGKRKREARGSGSEED